jgi:hypothetical protein
MGTTLTGTTPQDTYDSLIKVTDNGPLSATAKRLSDGLGNDSTLYLSTTSVGIGVASPVETLEVGGTTLVKSGSGTTVLAVADTSTGGKQYSLISAGTGNVHSVPTGSFYIRNSTDGVTAMTLTSTGNVGIGTSSPEALLHVNKSTAGGEGGFIYIDNPAASTLGNSAGIKFATSNGGSFATTPTGSITNIVTNSTTGASDITFGTFNGVSVGERMRILAAGGLTFNGDTAAANALDDYEEGTWTPNFTLTSGTVTAHTASGSYTKIGRQVSLTLSITFTTTLLAEINTITGMPFTAQNTAQTAMGAIRENNNTGDMWQLRINPNETSGLMRRYDNDTSIANGDIFIGTLTYFV